MPCGSCRQLRGEIPRAIRGVQGLSLLFTTDQPSLPLENVLMVVEVKGSGQILQSSL